MYIVCYIIYICHRCTLCVTLFTYVTDVHCVLHYLHMSQMYIVCYIIYICHRCTSWASHIITSENTRILINLLVLYINSTTEYLCSFNFSLCFVWLCMCIVFILRTSICFRVSSDLVFFARLSCFWWMKNSSKLLA
jgi:hypothetical protein